MNKMRKKKGWQQAELFKQTLPNELCIVLLQGFVNFSDIQWKYAKKIRSPPSHSICSHLKLLKVRSGNRQIVCGF